MQGKVEICGVNTAALPVLKSAETRALLERARAGDRGAREQLISGNLRLVLSVVQKFANRGESMDDLFQVGVIGLIKAVDAFDLTQNVQFSTYGVPAIMGWRKASRRLYPMTRKQALELAVQTLAGNEEAVQVLHTMIDELPLNRWTEAAIRDSVEQFILDNGRPPLRTDFKKKCLPPHSVIKHRFGLTLQEWLDLNYPTEKTPLDELHAQATQDFIREYLRIQPVSAEDYNARRTHPSRGWYAIAKYNHTRRWRILLERLNLPIYNNRGTPNSTPQLKVRVISDYNFEDDNPSD
jgi:RNA polymerase sigma factor (sigma-70 family)